MRLTVGSNHSADERRDSPKKRRRNAEKGDSFDGIHRSDGSIRRDADHCGKRAILPVTLS